VISRKSIVAVSCCGVIALGVAACGSSSDDDNTTSASAGSSDVSGLNGSIRVDGSSTVGPLTQAVAEQFNGANPDVDVSVGVAGTGGGFEKFCVGETDISDASRPIEPEEAKICKEHNISYEEVQVANDALTVVVNPANPNDCLSVEQLAQIWGPDNTVNNWGDVKGADSSFSADIERFGPGTTSGTFDFFTGAINGEEGVQTKDYNNVGENDNQTVTGVEGAEGGIGYFGYSYYKENATQLKALEIKNPDTGKCVAPSPETVQDGSYAPLGRPLFIYPSTDALKDQTVDAFVKYYVDNINSIAPGVGFIELTPQQLSKSKKNVASITG
jgi:phosphate transport system substrate-binding protein